MITIQDTIYMGTAAPASGGGGSGDAVWGAITGTLSDQTDLQNALNTKQGTLTAGSGISINNGTISVTSVESVANQNTNTGAVGPLKIWNGTQEQWESGGSQTWYGWDSISPLGTTTYYLESSSPQQGDIVYSAPNVATTGTVQTIMSSTMVSTTNGLVLQYNASHNQTAQGNLGQEHPDWLFNINGVGVKLGTIDIANYMTYTAGNNVSINNGVISAINTTYTAGNNISIRNNVISATNTTYSPFTGATSSAAGSAGLVPMPTTTDVGKYLKGDGTWASVAVSEITNQNTESGAVTPLKIWNGTESQWNNGGSQTWYCWDEFQGGVGVVGTWYTLDDPENITTETVLYSAPNVVDTSVTVTYGGYRSFSASNGHTGMYNSSGNQTTTTSIGESHPDWLCNINGVGVKIGTTDVANLASYSAFTGATSSVAGSTGLVPAPTTVDVDKYLKGDGTWAAVSVSEITNQNTNTGAASPLKIWHGTEVEWNTGGNSQTWYNWKYESGIEWTQVEQTYSDAYWYDLVYGYNKFVAVPQDEDDTIIYSNDGISWTQVDGALPAQDNWQIAYGNNKYIAVSYTTIAYSDDGITWIADSDNRTGETIVYGNGTFIVAYRGNILYTVDNGTTWSSSSLPFSNSAIMAYGNNKFIAINSNNSNEAAYSTDGNTWTSVTLPNSANWKDVTFGNGKFVAIAYNSNAIVYSTDGVNWASGVLPSSQLWSSISYGNSTFIVTCQGTAIAYSNDGINWIEESLIEDHYWICSAYGADKFIILARSGDILYSVSDSLYVFTTSDTPTTSDTVYSAPSTPSALTITSVGTGTITLSDTNIYNYNAGGNQTITQTVGEAHPDWLCFIDGVGIKKGTTAICVVDQTYNASSTNAQSGVAVNSVVGDIETALAQV